MDPEDQEPDDKIRRLQYDKNENPGAVALATRAVRSGTSLLGRRRLLNLWTALSNTNHLSGDVLEVGVYRGGSAWFIARALRLLGSGRRLDAVDTFEGHPPQAAQDQSPYQTPGHFGDVDFEAVQRLLGQHANTTVHRSTIEEAWAAFEGKQFSMIHLDVDIEPSTRFVLERAPAQLMSGGAIVVDDYGSRKCPGIQLAVAQFVESHQRGFFVVPLLTEQCILIRLR